VHFAVNGAQLVRISETSTAVAAQTRCLSLFPSRWRSRDPTIRDCGTGEGLAPVNLALLGCRTALGELALWNNEDVGAWLKRPGAGEAMCIFRKEDFAVRDRGSARLVRSHNTSVGKYERTMSAKAPISGDRLRPLITQFVRIYPFTLVETHRPRFTYSTSNAMGAFLLDSTSLP
jgi:hypothetical protein